MHLFVSWAVVIVLHAFKPCSCGPYRYFGNGEIGIELVRRVKNNNGIVSQRQLNETIKLPDDMIVTCKACRPTSEKCTSIKSVVTKPYATTVLNPKTSPSEPSPPLSDKPPSSARPRCPKPKFPKKMSTPGGKPTVAAGTGKPATGAGCAAESESPVTDCNESASPEADGNESRNPCADTAGKKLPFAVSGTKSPAAKKGAQNERNTDGTIGQLARKNTRPPSCKSCAGRVSGSTDEPSSSRHLGDCTCAANDDDDDNDETEK